MHNAYNTYRQRIQRLIYAYVYIYTYDIHTPKVHVLVDIVDMTFSFLVPYLQMS